ncbi:hypothetical protein OE88DRAFT_1667994 [Heliocybe sulcata]|uniref:Uncharacterized protein n=1 Tax=Heliocybe sulcata TaxID=5364 RepID=A0A5C3ML82_9AGAM|nr:hypothetical protein OE88DRAFT_1667994 [Heliocybe sulcata]
MYSSPMTGKPYLRLPTKRGTTADHLLYESDASSLIAISLCSNSTSSGNIGPGRVLDGIFNKLGNQLTSFLSHISERKFRKGPNALVSRMLHPMDWGNCTCVSAWCPDNSKTATIPALGQSSAPRPPSIQRVVETLWASTCATCRERYAESLASSHGFERGCRKLLKALEYGSKSTQLLAAYYIVALLAFHPIVYRIFVQNDAHGILHHVLDRSRFFSEGAISVALRRALGTIDEINVLNPLKEIEALRMRIELDYYLGDRMSESEMLLLLPQVTRNHGLMLERLKNPQSGLVVASVLPLAQKAGWWPQLAVVPAFGHILDPPTTKNLWTMLCTSSDAMFQAVLGSFIRSLYNFAANNIYARSESSRALPSNSSILWSWRSLWMPLFRLRLNTPGLLCDVSQDILKDVCSTFWSQPRAVGLMCSEPAVIEDVKALHLAIHSLRNAPSPYPCERQDDFVYILLQQLTSPLFEVIATFAAERSMSEYASIYELERAIPRQFLNVLCQQVSDKVLAIPDKDAAASAQVLSSIFPSYDTISMQAMEQHLGTLSPPARKSANILKFLRQWRPMASTQYYWCTGVSVGVRPSRGSEVAHLFEDHPLSPYQPPQRYTEYDAYMILLARQHRRDLRWVPFSEFKNSLDDYVPLLVHLEGAEHYLARIPGIFAQEPQLTVLNREEVHLYQDPAADQGSLHVLCAVGSGQIDDCAFWMTGQGLVNAITGESCSTRLHTDIVFARCFCCRNWPECV